MTNQRIQRRWEIAEVDRAASGELARSLRVPRIVAHILMRRGVSDIEGGRRFLHPSIEHLSDPFSLTDMQPAVDRIQLAKERQEHVRVFGDYDVDGVAGTAILVQALQRFGISQYSYAMPDRVTEGYGIKPDHVKQAQQEGVDLLITVDNGISAFEAAGTARDCGIDVIVTDHHSLGDRLPEACAVINPKREPPSHPAADLCGAAVALKFAQALTGTMDGLDFAALGTVADIVPLRGENRDLTAAGLDCIARNPRLGLEQLAQVAGIRIEELRADGIAFQLGPRINAGGRLGDGTTGLRLLLTDSPTEAAEAAKELDSANYERRTIERQILDEALAQVEDTLHPKQRSIVLGAREWHPGVVGIVASRVLSRYYRPVLLVAFDEDGVGRGSARSIPELDIMEVLEGCADHLDAYGGHRAAAGITVLEQDFAAFRERFEAEAARLLPDGELQPTLDIDGLISFSEIDGQMVRALEQLRPFGHGNPSSILCTFGATVLPNSWRAMRGGHLRVTLKEGPSLFTAVGFGMGDVLQDLPNWPTVDAAFNPRLNTWRGETTVQLVLKDIRPAASGS